MKAIILAAGSDDRLGNLTQGKPKCLIEIEGCSLLEIQINTLHASGIEDIVVVTGYKAEQITIPGLTYYNNPDYESTNVLHSLMCAREELNGDCLILYGDILFEEQMVKRMLESNNHIAVGAMINWPVELYGTEKEHEKLEIIYIDAENKIKRIGKNLADKYETQAHFTGMVKCSDLGIDFIKRNFERLKGCYENYSKIDIFNKLWLTDLFNEMSELGVPLQCVLFERGWIEINTEQDYEKALHNTDFIRRFVKIQTDWGARSQTYESIKWVNMDDTLDAMIDFAGNLENKKVLDVGTGTGKVLKSIKKHFDSAQYFGIDASPEMMDKIDPELNFKLIVNSMEDMSCFTDNEFDLVTARMSLHHSNDINKTMSEIYRITTVRGKFIICEGNPPDRNSVAFYDNMFRFKENRITFLLDDLTNLLFQSGFNTIVSRTIFLKDMSLNNWLLNAGVPFRNIDIIRRLHFECDPAVKKAYNMRTEGDDILMDWKFSVVCGSK